MKGRTFEELLDRYAAPLRRLCSVYEQDRSDQQDLFQEIALAVWVALPRFRGDASERTWLYRIAHNVAITMSIRKGRRRRREVAAAALPAPAVTPAVPRDERREQLLDAIRRLRPVDRELVLLYLEGLSTAEIAAVLGVTETNAAVRLSRVRQRLSAMLLQSREAHT